MVETGNKCCWKHPVFGGGDPLRAWRPSARQFEVLVRSPRERAADAASSTRRTDVWMPFKPRGAGGTAVGAQIFRVEKSQQGPSASFLSGHDVLNVRRGPSCSLTAQRGALPCRRNGETAGARDGPGERSLGYF